MNLNPIVVTGKDSIMSLVWIEGMYNSFESKFQVGNLVMEQALTNTNSPCCPNRVWLHDTVTARFINADIHATIAITGINCRVFACLRN